MNIQLTREVETSSAPKLFYGDRCDACGFQARIVTQTTLGEFWFCGHDWQELCCVMEEITLQVSEQSFEEASRPREIDSL